METKESEVPFNDRRMAFQEEFPRRFKKWTNLENEDIVEALRDMTGDTFHEMRRLISVVLSLVETEIACGRYPGYSKGRALTQQERDAIRTIPNEDLKRALKENIEKSWQFILDKQKVGVDKLAVTIRPHLKQ